VKWSSENVQLPVLCACLLYQKALLLCAVHRSFLVLAIVATDEISLR